MSDDTDENADSTDEEPQFYAYGEPVKVRGVEFGPEQTRNGQDYIQWYAHVQFAEQVQTTRVHPGQLQVSGGAEAMYENFRQRGLMPDWLIDNVTPPWDDDPVPEPDEDF